MTTRQSELAKAKELYVKTGGNDVETMTQQLGNTKS